LDRTEVTHFLASAVGLPHVVDLKQPDKVIVVEVFKNLCALSVVVDYYLFKRYNVQSMALQRMSQEESITNRSMANGVEKRACLTTAQSVVDELNEA
jgi:hypothetical protein